MICGISMKKLLFLLLLIGFTPLSVHAESQKSGMYLENPRHVQVPQWEHEDWYLEDWFTQVKGMDMVKGFYKADIFRDQYQVVQKPKVEEKNPVFKFFKNLEMPDLSTVKKNNGLRTLVVGPAFYHLSGFDKRRVVAVLDATYGVTQHNKKSTFVLQDWNTEKIIGVYDQYGLRLH